MALRNLIDTRVTVAVDGSFASPVWTTGDQQAVKSTETCGGFISQSPLSKESHGVAGVVPTSETSSDRDLGLERAAMAVTSA